MCGVVGFIDGRLQASERVDLVGRMAAAIEHRGPDASGMWIDPSGHVALGHRRLAIIDLTEAGAQPMVSVSGQHVLAFNGEIYNHRELRAELDVQELTNWRGHSDTETLLVAFERWGVEATLARCVGMFAIALWRRSDRTLFLARDRFGEKPLYYGWAGGRFVFGSELKALRAVPGFSNQVCREALAQYFRFQYVPAPRSIYQGIFKLEPGCLLAVRDAPPSCAPSQLLQAPARHENLTLTRWWSLASLVETAAERPLTDEREALAEVERTLKEAVRLQSLADVPLGAFLSGGIDSSTIVALMQEQVSRPVKTFSVGFEVEGFNEAPFARAVARHLGTEHTEFIVTAEDARAVIPRLPVMYDEPFADSSQIPTHLVCRAARKHVTVALSGDAGDELFGGYNRHIHGPPVWRALSWLPFPIRRWLGSIVSALALRIGEPVEKVINQLLQSRRAGPTLAPQVFRLGERMREARNLDDFYLSLVSAWQGAGLVLVGGYPVVEPAVAAFDWKPSRGVDQPALLMMYRDTTTYLPDDILCKVDRAAMSVSLETRVPFLDHRVAEAAWRLPLSMKVRGPVSKWALRQLLLCRVPPALTERPKAGFAMPVGDWIRGPLRPWVEELIRPSRLESEGFIDPVRVQHAWREHLSGHHDWTQKLWSVVMFESWLDEVHGQQ